MSEPRDSGGPGGEGPRKVQRIPPRGRVQLRAALALEEAGELEEAARLFEHVGEHAQAASLRLEHAQTLHDEHHRLAVLREGAARNMGDTEQGAALHRALARVLLARVETMADGARRRGLLVEAAQALEEASDAEEAGRLYERLGMLARAAAAYESAGTIGELERVLALLEGREQLEHAVRQLERDVEDAWAEGRRSLARTLMSEHVRDAERQGRSPSVVLVRRLGDLERTQPRPDRIHLSHGPRHGEDRVLHVYLGDQLRIGRAPDCELRVGGPALSREHVVLRAEPDERGRPSIRALDRGTPAGTFWDGAALAPGEPLALEHRAQLGLGFSTTVEVAPIPGRGGVMGALVRGSEREWRLFLPRGGPLLLDPTRLAPASLERRGGFVTLCAAGSASLWLDGRALGGGAVVELLVHDRVRIEAAGEPSLMLEVIG